MVGADFHALGRNATDGGALAGDRIRVGTPEPTAFVFSPVNVATETGIFKTQGLEVERFDFAGGAKLHQAMVAGALDVVIGTGSDILFPMKGARERAVAAASCAPGSTR